MYFSNAFLRFLTGTDSIRGLHIIGLQTVKLGFTHLNFDPHYSHEQGAGPKTH